MGKKNILMLISQMSLGGAEKVFFDHARAFSKYHNVVECVFTQKGYEPTYRTGNTVLELDDIGVKGSLNRFLYRKKRLAAFISNQKIDVCISHMEGPNILNCWTSQKCKKIICIHGSIKSDSGKSAIKKAVLNKFILPVSYKRSDKLIAVSNTMKRELESIGLPPEKVQFIPNFFDISKIKEAANEPLEEYSSIFQNNDILIHIGRLSVQKNQRVLIDIMAALKRHGREEKLCIIGEGELKDELISYAEAKGLNVYQKDKDNNIDDVAHDVFFLGKQLNPYRFIARAKLFLLSSFFEGFPLVLGESLACGLPVVAVDCQTGPREILNFDMTNTSGSTGTYELADCGILVPDWQTGNLNETQLEIWVNAISKLIDDRNLYDLLQVNAASKIVLYGKDNVMQNWLQLIESV